MIQSIMQELLQQIDLDYYRSVRLLIVHAELDQLRQGRPASVDVRSGEVRVGRVNPHPYEAIPLVRL